MAVIGRRLRRWAFRPRRVTAMAPAQAALVYTLLALWSLVALFPLYWLLVTSLKLPVQVASGPVFVPFVDFEPSLHAWRYILVDLGRDTLRPYLNSILVAGCSTGLAVLIGSMAAYALTRIAYQPRVGNVIGFLVILGGVVYLVAAVGLPWPITLAAGAAVFVLFMVTVGRRFRWAFGNDDILFWMISQRILPPVVVVLPIYVMFQRLALLDTHIALIVTYTTVNLPIVIWLMRDFFHSIPIDLEESAELDGASRLEIFRSIVLPLAKPGLAATLLLVLILSWNEYLLALFLATAKAQTMPLLVAAQHATRGPQWWYMSAIIILMILPVIAMAAMLQRFITRGLLLGAIKG